MEVLDLTIDRQATVRLPWQPYALKPVGDVQYGSEDCAEGDFRADFKWALEAGCYFVGMGDYLDFSRPTMRRLFYQLLYDDDTSRRLVDEAVQNYIERFLKRVKGSEGRWLGLLAGHHYHEFSDGTTSDQYIARALGAPYLGTCAHLRLRFLRSTNLKHAVGKDVEVLMHHGSGSAQTTGGMLAAIERWRVAWPGVRLVLCGHHHRVISEPFPRIFVTWGKEPRAIDEPGRIVLTGGYLRGYTVGRRNGARPEGGYVEKRRLRPTVLGSPTIFFKPTHHAHNDSVDISVLD